MIPEQIATLEWLERNPNTAMWAWFWGSDKPQCIPSDAKVTEANGWNCTVGWDGATIEESVYSCRKLIDATLESARLRCQALEDMKGRGLWLSALDNPTGPVFYPGLLKKLYDHELIIAICPEGGDFALRQNMDSGEERARWETLAVCDSLIAAQFAAEPATQKAIAILKEARGQA